MKCTKEPHYVHVTMVLIKNYVRNTQSLLSALYKTFWYIEYIALSEKNNTEFCDSYIHTRKSYTDLPTSPSQRHSGSTFHWTYMLRK